MNNNKNILEILLIIFSFILTLTGILVFCSKSLSIINTIVLLFISIIFLLMSHFFQKQSNRENVSDLYQNIGFIFLILSYVNIGISKHLGGYFSLTGGGSNLFLASIILIMGLLAILMMIKKHNMNYIHLLYLSLIGTLFFILKHFEVDKVILDYIFNFDKDLLYLFLTFILCIINLSISAFHVIKKDVLKTIYRVLYLLGFIFIVYHIDGFSLFVVAIIMIMFLITSLVDAFLYQDDEREKYLFVLKLLISIKMIYASLFLDLSNFILFALLNGVALIIYKSFKDEKIKKFIKSVTILIVIYFLLTNVKTINNFIGNMLIFIIDYIVLIYERNKQNCLISNLSIIFLVTYLCWQVNYVSLYTTYYLISVLILGVFIFLYKDAKFIFTFGSFGILFFIYNYFEYIFVNEIGLILFTVIFYILLIAYATKLLKVKISDLFLTIVLAIWFLIIPKSIISAIIILLTSVMMILYSLKNTNYKHLIKGGIFGILIGLLNVIDYFTQLNWVMMVLVLSATIVIYILILLNKKEELKYCSSCGSKVKKQNFCGKCGNKL